MDGRRRRRRRPGPGSGAGGAQPADGPGGAAAGAAAVGAGRLPAGRPGRRAEPLPGWEPRAGEHLAPAGRWCCATAARPRCCAGSRSTRASTPSSATPPGARGAGPDRRGAGRRGGGRPHPRRGGGRVRGRARPRARDPLRQPPRAAGGRRGRGGHRLAAGRGGRRPAPLRRRARPVRGPHPDRLRPGLALGPGPERPVGHRLPAGPAAGVRGRRVRGAPHRRARDRLRPGQPVRGPHRQPGAPARRAAFTSRLVRGHHTMP